jgi:uncharacterized membrane protein YgcG
LYRYIVHCMHGKNRSVAATVSYLVLHRGAQLEAAYDHVKKLRHQAHVRERNTFHRELTLIAEGADLPAGALPGAGVLKKSDAGRPRQQDWGDRDESGGGGEGSGGGGGSGSGSGEGRGGDIASNVDEEEAAVAAAMGEAMGELALGAST